MVQVTKKPQVFAPCKAGVEALVGTCMVAEMAPDCSRITDGIKSGDKRCSARGEEQCGENPQQRGFTGAVGAEQGDRFAGFNAQRDPAERRQGRSGKWLQKSAPAAENWGEGFFQRIDGNSVFRHSRVYSVSPERKQ